MDSTYSLEWFDTKYSRFLDLIRYMQPTNAQLDDFQEAVVLCPAGQLEDEKIFGAFSRFPETTITTVSRAAAQRVNEIVIKPLFGYRQPLSQTAVGVVAQGNAILAYRGMKIVINENRDKTSRIVKGQDATLVHGHGTTLVVLFSEGERRFAHPVTHAVEGEGDVTRY